MCKLTQNTRQLLNLEIIAHVGQHEPKHEGMRSSCQVLGWHSVNYICYFIALMLMPWQCPDTLGYNFLLNLQPKLLLWTRAEAYLLIWVTNLMLLTKILFQNYIFFFFFSWVNSYRLPVQEESGCEQGMWREVFWCSRDLKQ